MLLLLFFEDLVNYKFQSRANVMGFLLVVCLLSLFFEVFVEGNYLETFIDVLQFYDEEAWNMECEICGFKMLSLGCIHWERSWKIWQLFFYLKTFQENGWGRVKISIVRLSFKMIENIQKPPNPNFYKISAFEIQKWPLF